MVEDVKSVSRIKDIHSGNAKLLQLEVGRLLTEIQQEQNQIATLDSKLTAAGQGMSLAALASRTTWLSFIQQQIHACQMRIHELQEQHTAAQAQWHAAEQQVDAIGTLLTARRADARREQIRKEIVEADEIVGRGSRGDSIIDS